MSLNISSNLVPQVVNNYNAYTGDDKMIGLADEVTLPKIKNKTTTVNGMGIGGDVDSPVPGQFESMEATLTWNTLYSYATKMLHPGRSVQITLRAAMQNEDKDGGYTYKGLRIVLGGQAERALTPVAEAGIHHGQFHHVGSDPLSRRDRRRDRHRHRQVRWPLLC